MLSGELVRDDNERNLVGGESSKVGLILAIIVALYYTEVLGKKEFKADSRLFRGVKKLTLHL